MSTGDVPEAGTDAKISLTLFGTKASTAPIELEKEEFRFERASTNRIAVCVVCSDVGLCQDFEKREESVLGIIG